MSAPIGHDVYKSTDGELRLVVRFHDGSTAEATGYNLRQLFIDLGLPARQATIEAGRYV